MPNVSLFKLRLLAIAVLLVAAPGCWCVYNGFDIEPEPDFTNPSTATTDGVVYTYPGNWTATTEVDTEDPPYTLTSTNLESIGDISATVMVYRPAIDSLTPRDFMEGFIEAMKQEVGDLSKGLATSSGKAKARKLERKLLGKTAQGTEGNFSLTLLGETEKMSMQVYTVHAEDRTIMCLVYASSNDMKVAVDAFEKIMDSMQFTPSP